MTFQSWLYMYFHALTFGFFLPEPQKKALHIKRHLLVYQEKKLREDFW